MRVWIWPAGFVLLALAGTPDVGAAEGGAAPPRAGSPEAVDAEMLRDLDLLSSPDYQREREVARRMGFFQRMRMLDYHQAQEAAGPDPNTAAPAKDAK
ncbi:MAG TPA: hypothetical protein VN323_07535 [Candidatus Dormibacteraeota bacterium]|nr:hypothetical protein [Candidatus Dormibacteraeota bacterium]